MNIDSIKKMKIDSIKNNMKKRFRSTVGGGGSAVEKIFNKA